ncbi:hypothetical protein PG984_008156 [Apiospora sp. TS-2023a]
MSSEHNPRQDSVPEEIPQRRDQSPTRETQSDSQAAQGSSPETATHNSGPNLTFEGLDGSSVPAKLVTRDELLQISRELGDGFVLVAEVDEGLKAFLRSQGLLPTGL